jgi:hypothetical protein
MPLEMKTQGPNNHITTELKTELSLKLNFGAEDECSWKMQLEASASGGEARVSESDASVFSDEYSEHSVRSSTDLSDSIIS